MYGGGTSSDNPVGDWSQRCITLSNTVDSEIAPCLPLPSLPVFCGAVDQELCLFDDQPRRPVSNRRDLLAQAGAIAELLRHTDVSYLDLKKVPKASHSGNAEDLDLCCEVLRYNPIAFEYNPEGSCRERVVSAVSERTPLRNSKPVNNQLHKDHPETRSQQRDPADPPSSSRKLKVKKKANQENLSSTVPDPAEHQDVVLKRFCEAMEEFCGRAEVPSGDRDEAEWESMPISDIKFIVNEIMSLKAEKMLHLTPVEILTRVLKVLDHQVHNAEGLSADECQHSDSDVSLIFVALESIQAALAVMAQPDMPKQLYNEEIIERVLEFLRRQIMDAMSASDPSYRATHKPKENAAAAGDEDDEDDDDYGSASKKRRVVKSVKPKRTAANRVSAASSAIYQKLCTILGFLRDLLLMERLSDSCILQLLKTSLSTFLVDNIQLLQLKAISLISGIFYSYPQHRSHIMDEVAQLLWKLPVSKRVARTYHLPDEEQKQIQMVSALLLQMVHHSSNVPESLRNQLNVTAISEPRLDSDHLLKCHEATTDTCASFWTRVLQRFAAVKNQDASELKVIMDNLVSDLLTTLNLPEYPASALLLEVLSVLLLQNAGPKSKDSSIRAMAIDLFGNIAARLKQDSSLCNRENFWMIQELEKADDSASNYPEDACSVCLDVRVQRSLVECHNCQRLFHADCIGVRQHDTSNSAWNCPFCLSRKHLLLLQSYCKSQSKASGKKSSESVPKIEILQQMLLNYLQDAGSADDLHLFTRWFHLCFWCKDDPKSEQKLDYHLARLKLKAIVRDSEDALLTRSSIKKISAFLGQKRSFCRGFDRILCSLLACLRENSPVVRAKALRAVSLIVEADPDVLCDERVQSAVEGRFCDSAISAREAALELVGRHIASHPDVGLKYFEKIAERVKDTGVSVRKRAIKIIRDMCVSNDNFPEATRACLEIISRVSDEESSIQDLVCKTFYEFWFEEPSGVQTQYCGDGSLVPSELAKKTEQIVDMLRKIPNHQPLVTVIKRNLTLDFFPQAVKAAGNNPVSLDAVHKRCELICKCLLEKILQVQEINDMEGEATMLPYVMALYAFCTVDPKLCAPASDPSQFIVTLQPYLKNQVDKRVAVKLLESIVFIIDAVLPYLRRLPTSIVEELEQDLKHIIIRHSFLTVVSAAIKCVCTVGKQAGKGAALVELLIQLFSKRLDATRDDNKLQVGRSLFCLGLLIRHGSSLLRAFNKVVNFDSSLVLFKRYLLAEDFAIKVRALQALGYVLIAKPECMLENDIGKIVAATLSSSSNVRLKMQSLQNIHEYLLDAESQLQPDVDESNVVDYPVEGGGPTVPYAAGAGDTNICGGIVQLYWDKILERTMDIDEQVRQSALKIVEVVLRQGLVHPITCVPYLIALETDPEEINSKLAHHLLINMNEKYPDFFESRLGDGLQLSFFFIQSMKENDRHLNIRAQANGGKQVKEKPDELSISNARLGVSRIYKLIRGNRVGRHKFMSSVVRKFDNPQWSGTVTPFLTYCAEILALLPFTTPDEPLYLIYIINRVIQVRSGTLEATMKAMSTYFSNRGSQKVLYENGCNQQDTTAHLTSAYTAMELGSNMISFHQNIEGQLLYPNLTVTDEGIDRSNPGNPYILTEEDRHRIQAECIAAIAIQLLLKLKRHLKIVYNLDDVRCQAFSPAEIPKTGEALSKQSIPFNIGDMHTDLPSNSQELTQRYQEYKSALREDTVDYSAYRANIKRRRPPAARRGGGRGSRTVPSRSIPRDEDDDDDDDENWSRSAQRNTVQRSYNTRTRQA